VFKIIKQNTMKKIFRTIVLSSMLSLFGNAYGQVQTLTIPITSSSDDAEEKGLNTTGTPGAMDLTSSDIELVNDGNDGDQFLGFRFTNITIPPGALISNAFIQFTVDETDASAGSITFKVEDIDNSTTFLSANGDISSRTALTDSVVWSNIPTWNTVGEQSVDQQTSDLSSLIQLMVNRSGWVSGNALNILATGTGERVAESYDGAPSNPPTLVIEYMIPTTVVFDIQSSNDDAEQDASSGAMDFTSSDLELSTDGSSLQVIGLRYDNITIPKGSTVSSAYIQFTVDEVNTANTVNLLLTVEEEDNSTPLTGTILSSRNWNLTSPIFWNSIPAWSAIDDAGVNQQSADVATLINQIVNRPGWSTGNAISLGMVDPFVMSVPGYTANSSKRVGRSYDNNPSKAAKLVVTYTLPASYLVEDFPIPANASWKYDDSGVDLTAASWTALNYNDTTWAFGNGVLGYGDNPTTTISYGSNSSAKHPTYYFRNTFNVADASIYDSLVFNLLRDDGAIVYVNGVEAFRMNMPAGMTNYNTLAPSVVSGTAESTYFEQKTGNLLVNGLNVIAVEIHQESMTSSDLSFDMEVGFEYPPLTPTTFPLVQNTEWHYLDNGASLDGLNWKDTAFNDINWDQGAGPLGYGNNENTIISYGPDAANKYITSYFRRDIMIDLATLPDSIQLGLLRDDGAIVYINGVEVRRDNLPSGTVTSSTNASSIISGTDEELYYTSNIYKTDFIQGVNQIAVEIHNRDSSSSDLGFDLYLDAAPVVNPPAMGCANGNGSHIGCFTSITPTSQTSNLLLPVSSHRFQALFYQGDAYTKGGGSAPGNHDFTAYIPLNGSSELGHLSVNHETSPGGVSILDISYNDSVKLWNVDSSQAVDFYNTDLVSTIRNCSGGITPWGTILTAEENLSSTDLNNDGYNDIGWLVEIDPITGKVMEYGNGIQEKLWGCGRIKHENALVLNDSITLYTGEDGGSSAVYKFIATTPGDLSDGSLYVLKLDSALVNNDPTGTTGSWIQVPNTTQADRNNTSTLAQALGGTNFNGVEDIEVNPLDGQIYFAAKGKSRVYRFTDNGTVIADFQTFVGGTDYVLNTESGIYTEAWGSGNDNLTFDDQGNLWVLQDGGNNYIWVVRPDHTQDIPRVELFASFPIGSEPTGLTFSPDYRFGFVSVQHPNYTNTAQLDATMNNVTFNVSATFVFSRSEHLGAQAPIAAFAVDTTVVIAGNSIAFTDTSLNYPTTRQWIFDGGVPAVSNNTSESVTYNGTGTYSVKLSVSNIVGSDVANYSQYIRVIDPAPVTQFAANMVNISTGDTVEFWDFSTNNPDSLSWTFTGGTPATSSDAVPAVTYSIAGVYAVSLKAYNEAGSGSTETKVNYINVSTPLGIAESLLNENVEVFPNPTSGLITLSMDFQGGEYVVVEAYDLTGKRLAVLLDSEIGAGHKDLRYDLSTVVTGNQTVILKINVDGNQVNRFIQVIK
jgi:PKD repeat protein